MKLFTAFCGILLSITLAFAQIPGIQNPLFFNVSPSSSPAPFPAFVNSANTAGASSGTGLTINLPASIVAGNMLFIAVSNASSATITSGPSGFTLLNSTLSAGSGSSSRRLSTYYKLATGSEGATIGITFSTTVVASAVSNQISGWGGTTPEFATAIGSSTTPDPPSLTTSYGALNILWLAVGAINANGISSYPSGFSNGANALGSGTAKPIALIASLQLNAATEDPGTIGTTSGGTLWTTSTIAIKP